MYMNDGNMERIFPLFNCRFSATAVDSPCKRIPISEELLEHIVRNALTAQIKQAEYFAYSIFRLWNLDGSDYFCVCRNCFHF